MTKEKLLETILTTSFTKVDAHRRIRLWREFLEQKYFGKGKKAALLEYLKKQEVSVSDIEAIDSWGEGFYDTFTKDDAYELTDILTESLKSLALISIYVPYEATDDDHKKFGMWVRANIDKYALIEIHVDSQVFGGCAVSVDGRYYDFSLRHRLETHTQDIHGILEKYVNAQ